MAANTALMSGQLPGTKTKMGPQISVLPDGRRMHLHHGPIDLIVQADGPGRVAGLRRGAERFATILTELTNELPMLRRSCSDDECVLQGAVARVMQDAAAEHSPTFVTPMAAVAGAVADAILNAICEADELCRVHVNNGGDIAFHLTPGEQIVVAVAGSRNARLTLDSASPVRGIATSGWRGRSHSLGIADSVTVLAASAARADVAATLIANAVDLPGHAAIARAPATDLFPDSDLGTRMVTIDVAPLSTPDINTALDRGARFASACQSRGLIQGAFLTLGSAHRAIGADHLHSCPPKESLDA